MPGLVNRLLKILFPKTRSQSHTTEKEGKAIREELKFLVFRSEVVILMDHHNTLATILQVIIQPGTQTSMEIVTREVERVMDALVLDLLGSYDEEKRPNTEVITSFVLVVAVVITKNIKTLQRPIHQQSARGGDN